LYTSNQGVYDGILGLVAWMGEMRNAYKILVRHSEGKR
jgi:hypothetical protein